MLAEHARRERKMNGVIKHLVLASSLLIAVISQATATTPPVSVGDFCQQPYSATARSLCAEAENELHHRARGLGGSGIVKVSAVHAQRQARS